MERFYLTDNDGHIEEHFVFSYSGGSAYGFSPPEPNPLAECAICGEACYNDDYMVDGNIVCPACCEYYNSEDIVKDYVKAHPEDLQTFVEDNLYESWFQQFVAEFKDAYEDEILKWIEE